MTQKEKRFDKITGLKLKTYLFADIKNFLESYDFTTESKGSSHFIFRRETFPHITIVTHNNQVKKVYVKRMVEIMLEYQILKSK